MILHKKQTEAYVLNHINIYYQEMSVKWWLNGAILDTLMKNSDKWLNMDLKNGSHKTEHYFLSKQIFIWST